MPSSRTVTVERLAEGSRRVMLDFTVPQDHELVILEDETHSHLIYGLAEELEAHGLKQAPKVEPKVVEKAEAPAPAAEKPKRKSPAKKSAAKKTSSKAKA